jgi:hypothetical protein
MTNEFFSWNTKKNDNGQFEAVVYKVTKLKTPNAEGKYADFTELQRVPCKTRATAKSHAQKWVRYYKAAA